MVRSAGRAAIGPVGRRGVGPVERLRAACLVHCPVQVAVVLKWGLLLVAAIVRRVLEHLVLGGDALLRWLRRHHLVVLSLLLGSGQLLLRPLNILMYEHLLTVVLYILLLIGKTLLLFLLLLHFEPLLRL